MSAELLGARRLRELFSERDFRPRKEMGQNFVVDPNTIRKMVETASLSAANKVVEVGAGAGSLTIGLSNAAGRVVALEYDRRLLPMLEETVGGLSNVAVIAADATRFDWTGIDADRLVANLPYNIAATIVLRVLEVAPQIEELTVMTQREVGERLAAGPGSKTYGHASVVVGFFADAAVAGRVSKRAFYPVPGVDSVIVRIVRKQEPPSVDAARLIAISRAAFGHRRKTLRNSLAGIAGSTRAAEEALAAAGIDPSERAERVGVDKYVELARVLG